MESQRGPRRDLPEISDRLQDLGWSMGHSSGSGGLDRSRGLVSVNEGARKDADHGRIIQNP